MNRTEKSYFSKFGFKYNKVNSDLDYLYRLIEKELSKGVEINLAFELKIKRKSKIKITSSKFPKVKKELMDLLLDSIYNHNKSKNDLEGYLYYLRRSDVLLAKNLKSYAYKEIEKGLIKALAAEQFEVAVLLQKKQNIIAALLQEKEKVSKGIEKQLLLSSQLKQKTDLQVLYDQVFQIYRSLGKDQELNLLKKLQELISGSILEKENLLSKTASYYKFAIRQVAAFAVKNEYLSLENSQKMLDVTLSYPKVFNRRPEAILPLITNLISDSLSLGIITYYHKYRPWLEEQTFYSESIRIKQHFQLVKVDLYHAYISNGFEKFIEIEKRFQDLSKSVLLGLDSESKITLSYLFINCFFLAGNFKKSVEWVNELLFLSKEGKGRESYIIESELILIVIHLEEKNTDILPSLIRSFQNRFQQGNKLKPREEAIFNFIKKLVNSSHSQKEVTILSEATIRLLENIPHKVNSMDFNFSIWLKSIRDKTSYSTLIQEQNQYLINAVLNKQGFKI